MNKKHIRMTNSPGWLQQRRGSDCTAAQSDACLRVGVIKIVIVINCNFITFSKVIACNCN